MSRAQSKVGICNRFWAKFLVIINNLEITMIDKIGIRVDGRTTNNDFDLLTKDPSLTQNKESILQQKDR